MNHCKFHPRFYVCRSMAWKHSQSTMSKQSGKLCHQQQHVHRGQVLNTVQTTTQSKAGDIKRFTHRSCHFSPGDLHFCAFSLSNSHSFLLGYWSLTEFMHEVTRPPQSLSLRHLKKEKKTNHVDQKMPRSPVRLPTVQNLNLQPKWISLSLGFERLKGACGAEHKD